MESVCGGVKLRYEIGDDEDTRREKLVQALQSYSRYWSTRRTLKEAAMTLPLDSLKDGLSAVLEASPVAWRLGSLVHTIDSEARTQLQHRSAGDGEALEPLEVVQAARTQWDARLRHRLRAMAAQQNRPLAQPRPQTHAETGPSRLVYAWQDLLEALESIVNPNASATFSRVLGWGLVKLCLRTPSMPQLREKFAQLRPDVRQVGLDDELLGLAWFREQRIREGEALLQRRKGSVSELRAFAETGVPVSLRPRLWKRILGVPTSDRDTAYYERLIADVRRWDLLTDDLYRLEVQETADHPEYFVFESMLDELMLAFSRDESLSVCCPLVLNSAPLVAPIVTAAASEHDKVPITQESGPTLVPPCQVVPFHRQVMLAAPMCYLCERPEQTYFIFRSMYIKYFSRLHIISSRPDTILFLSKHFEDMVQSCHPQAFYHAVEFGVAPLKIAFPWLFTAFSGYLSVDQVMILWDRILAYDSLELLSILAAAIFLYRAKSVLNASSAEEIRDIFEDGNYFRVLPLLQHFLFS